MTRRVHACRALFLAFALMFALAACSSGSDGTVDVANEPAPTNAEAAPTRSPVDTSATAPASDAFFTTPSQLDFTTIADGIEQGPAYGDPTTSAHGSFMRFQPGAIVPSHFYSRALRGIVVLGEISNPTVDEPSTEATQTPGGYFSWPAQSEHVTECVDATECHFFIVQDGPFELSQAGADVPEPSDGTETAAGVAVEKVHFTTVDDIDFVELVPGVEQGAAWGDPSTSAHGSFMRFEPGATVPAHSYSEDLRGVVIEGRVANPTVGVASSEPSQGRGGFYFLSAGAVHETSCVSDTECLFFVYQAGPFVLTMAD